jgi:hypothetical protein
MWKRAAANSLQAVQEKYGSQRFLSVSNIDPPEDIPSCE